MAVHALAGKPAPRSLLVSVPPLISDYYTRKPKGPVAFGTSGHRGTSLNGTFVQQHIEATTQALCEYRSINKIKGPLFLGIDTHALSEPAFRSALEVFAANGVEVIIHQKNEFTPTPVISFLVIKYNKGRTENLADGVVITPSHNPPQDGGFKYNPPHGGPADVDATNWIQNRANKIMADGNKEVKKIPFETALKAGTTHEQDFITPFVDALGGVVDMEAIRSAGIVIGADPMGGAGVHYWGPIAERYGLNLTVVNQIVDPTFGFMPVDADGKIRMDCSSPYAMAGLIAMKDRFTVAFGNDPDFDRHGIVDGTGLLNPNHYLSVAIWYLAQNRPNWPQAAKFGKTLVSSSMIDMVVSAAGRKLWEVPVGFKWFVPGLADGTVSFGGEESAGASMLCMNGSTWTTDKDGFSLTLLAAEIAAKIGKTPGEIYQQILVPQHGNPYYKRADFSLTPEANPVFRANLAALPKKLNPGMQIAGLEISSIIEKAPGNNASMGGVKVSFKDGSWFAVRPSGTEPKGKLYAESSSGRAGWQAIHDEVMPMLGVA